MTPLRIVIVMIEPPLPFGNAAARWYYVLLKGLVARGHRVTAFAACGKAEEIKAALQLFPAPEYDLRCYPFSTQTGLRAKYQSWRQPFSYVFNADLRRDLDRELALGFDVLHLEMHWSGWLGIAHPRRSLLNVHYLYEIDWPPDTADAASRKYRDLALRSEAKLLGTFPFIRTLTGRLTHAVQARHPRALVTTVPLAFDVSLYEFQTSDRTAEPTIGLVGSFNWRPSLSAAKHLLENLWPAIKEKIPAARLLIVGRDARSALAEYLDLPAVEIHENVPDVTPFLRRMKVMLYAPSVGSGMKVKVLESMALGVPVVTNAEGVEGLNALDGVHAGIAEDDAGLIERAVTLLSDPALAARQCLAARALIEQECAPGAALDQLEEIFRRIAQADEISEDKRG